MSDSDNPPSDNGATTICENGRENSQEDGRAELSIIRSVSAWLMRAFARNDEATWQESLEELIEEEEEISEQITPEEREFAALWRAQCRRCYGTAAGYHRHRRAFSVG